VLAVPGLIAEDDGSVSLRVFPSEAARNAPHPHGVARLLAQLEPLRVSELRLSDRDKLALGRNPHGSVAALLDDASEAVARDLMEAAGGPPLTAEEFEGLRAEYRRRRAPLMRALLLDALPAMETWWSITELLEKGGPTGAALPSRRATPASLTAAYDDIATHLADLMDGRVLTRVRQEGIADLRRYLTALRRRINALPADAARDLARMEQVHRVEDAYLSLTPKQRATPEARAIRADLAELRVSLWAQDLGTVRPVSAKRLLDRIAALSR
jgi:ATP-dependent helicase HrpA